MTLSHWDHLEDHTTPSSAEVIPDLLSEQRDLTWNALKRHELSLQVAANESSEINEILNRRTLTYILTEWAFSNANWSRVKRWWKKWVRDEWENAVIQWLVNENLSNSAVVRYLKRKGIRISTRSQKRAIARSIYNTMLRQTKKKRVETIETIDRSVERVRQEIQNEMSGYPPFYRYVKEAGTEVNLYPSSIPNARNKHLFLWQTPGTPLHGKPINSDLFEKIDKTDNTTEPTTYIYIKWRRTAMVTYIGWKLVFASYTAKWSTGFRSPEEVRYTSYSSKMHWISGAPESSKYNSNRGRWEWAPMPYSVAVNAKNGIHAHGWRVGPKNVSHGCFRLPLFYAKGFYEIFNDQAGGRMNWVIGDLY